MAHSSPLTTSAVADGHRGLAGPLLWQNLDDQMPGESWDVRAEPPAGLGDCDVDDIGRTGLG
jgi:hypothetical protein